MTEPDASNPELLSDALLSLRTESSKADKKTKTEPGTAFEVFRNKTTAVEVIVKEVPQKARKKMSADDFHVNSQYLKIRELEETNQLLVNELNKSKGNLVKITNRFHTVIAEMKKQVDSARSHEVEAQEKCLSLLFENEKLKALLQSKNKMVVRLKTELMNLGKVIKLVIKSMSVIPPVSQVTFNSDTDYEVFEQDLKKDVKFGRVRFLGSFYDGTFNSSNLSKDMKEPIEKRF